MIHFIYITLIIIAFCTGAELGIRYCIKELKKIFPDNKP